MARFDRMDNGSPAEEEMKARAPKVGRSAHDFSTSVAGNCLLGMLVPVDWFPVVPSETVQMSISGTVEFRNPTNRPILNGFRTYFHVRYNRLVDLWEGAKNFVDKGRSGNIDLQLPNCIYRGSFTNDSSTVLVNANTPMSLINFFKMPAQVMQKKLGTTSSGQNVNRSPLRQFQAVVVPDASNLGTYADVFANQTDFLPAPLFFSYQRNWRDFYSPKNLLQDNKFWFPDNEDHFILSYSCTDAVAICYGDEGFNSAEDSNTIETYRCLNLCGAGNPAPAAMASFLLGSENLTPEPNNPSVQPPDASQVFTYRFFPNLCGIKFVQFRGDRFTTSSPFPDLIRGDVPILELTQDNFVRTLVTKAPNQSDVGKTSILDGSAQIRDNPVYRSDVAGSKSSLGNSNDTVRFGLITPESSVTMSDLYTLETLTAFKRKLGMTNGDYNEAVKAQFGYDPHVHSREATYIGGFYMDMNLSTVVQQSETSSTPLGTKAGNGLSAGSGNIGSFNVPDYGYITTYMFVVPNVYYTQGKYRFLSEKSPIELYFPIFNNLPAQAIRNDELFISGTPTTDAAPFSYEDRYAHYKSRSNFVCGFMGLPVSKARYDSAKIMARRFSSRPQFNAKFVSMIPENQDMNVFSVLDEPPLDFNVNINVRRVFPGPYMAIEGSLSSPALNS